MSEAPTTLLQRWLEQRLPERSRTWLAEQLAAIAATASSRALFVTLGMIPRRLGKVELALQEAELGAAEQARPGWDPGAWSLDVAARVLAVCTAARNAEPFATLFAELCASADPAEAVALYSGLPLYPSPAALEPQVGEGLRTNVRAQFEAIAHRNPYPREQFDEHRWNHMVLKALFIGSRLDLIQGLDERTNPELARILCDYARERWAAQRTVTPELWRGLGPYAAGELLADLERVLASDDALERQAGALALSASTDPAARAILDREPELAAAIGAGRLGWPVLTNKLFGEAPSHGAAR